MVAIMQSYDQVGRKEDVSDIITNLSPTKTPFQTMIGSEGIHNIVHSWQEDSLIAAGANAAQEGADAPTAVMNATVLRTGTTQIFTKTAKVSGTTDAIQTYGRDRELAYQLGLRSSELKRDFEFALVGANTTQVTGDDNTARKFASYLAQVATAGVYNMDSGNTNRGLGLTGGTAETITETSVLAVSQQLFNAGADPSVLMIKPADALVVPQWQRSSVAGLARTTYVENGQKNIVNVVDTYVSPFGELKVVMNRFQLVSTALIFDPSMWKKLVLRNWFRQTLAKTGDSTNVQILGEFGLKHRNQVASGAVKNLT
jgi:hypothetical protein